MAREHLSPRACRRGLLAVFTAGVVAACASTSQPSAFNDRQPLTACGEIDTSDGMSSREGRAAECLREAWVRGTGVELVVAQAGTEGGTVTSYLRVLEAGAGEQWVNDQSKDGTGWSLRGGCKTLAVGAQGGPSMSDCPISATP